MAPPVRPGANVTVAQLDRSLRQALISTSGALLDARLNSGTAGNVSARVDGGFLISPSGLAPARCGPEDIVLLDLDGHAQGSRRPSSEWRFHLDLYASRPEIGAIIHTHSPFATTLACQRRSIPPFHYTVARFGGNDLRCAGYAAFGSAELSRLMQTALQGRSACLMANHGATVLGRDLDEAVELAFELEGLCELYWRALQGGPPVLLSEAEMADVLQRYRSYGQRAEVPA
jgi:L-fuculose-phosphate aldolase